jgi:hypothetical protein
MDQEEPERRWNGSLDETFARFFREDAGAREGGVENARRDNGNAKPQRLFRRFKGAFSKRDPIGRAGTRPLC